MRKICRNTWKIWRIGGTYRYEGLCGKYEGINEENMKECDEKCAKYEGIYENIFKIWRNTWEYVRNMKNYGALGIRIAKRGASRHIFLSLYIKVLEFGIKFRALSPYRLWDLIKFRIPPFIWALGLGKIPRPSFLLSSGTWKNFKLCLYIGLYRLWDLEKFHARASS